MHDTEKKITGKPNPKCASRLEPAPILIKNGQIVDGSGAKPFFGDILLKNGKIHSIADHIPSSGESDETVLDAAGAYVTPGFIDIHRHSDAFVFKEGYGEIQLRQGITTTINGNCGLSIVPCPTAYRDSILSYLKPIIGAFPGKPEFETFSEYLSLLEKQRLPFNYGMHIGNGTMRMAVKGFESGQLSDTEIASIHRYLQDALENGAFGVSMGLAYVPENQYTPDEMVRVLQPIKDSGIPIVTHMRGEGDLLYSAVSEVIEIAERLNVPLHISHFKCLGKKNWGHMLEKCLRLIRSARERGLQITFDVYPWTAGSTQLVQILPPEFLKGGLSATTAFMKDPQKRRECRKILEQPQTDFENQVHLIGWENIVVTTLHQPENKTYIGKSIAEIAAIQQKDPFDTAFDLLAQENCNISMINFIACETDIETIITDPYSYVISDSIYPDGGNPHPRQYGTFAKLLQEYVRERHILSIEAAIHKISGAPAETFHIANKGRIKEGYDADLAIFDLNRIQNRADYLNPRVLSEGFSYVLVGGMIANDHDRFIHTGAGRVLRRSI